MKRVINPKGSFTAFGYAFGMLPAHRGWITDRFICVAALIPLASRRVRSNLFSLLRNRSRLASVLRTTDDAAGGSVVKVLRVNLGAVLPPSARIRIQNSVKGHLHARIQFESAGRRVGEIASVIFGQTVHGHLFG